MEALYVIYRIVTTILLITIIWAFLALVGAV